MSGRPRRYVLVVGKTQLAVPAADVLPFVRGFTLALGHQNTFASILDADGPEDTKRMQAMQTGHQMGLWDYRYIEH